MKRFRFSPLVVSLFAIGIFVQAASAQISMNAGNSYSQGFDSLTNSTWADNSTLAGWYADKLKGGDITAYVVGTGVDTTAGLHSFGAAGSTERALGALVNGTPGDIAYGVRFTNDTATIVANITISYTGEEWRRQNTVTQTLAFSYAITNVAITTADPLGTSYSWIPFHSLDFASPTTGSGTASLDGNNATNRHIFSSMVLSNVLVLPGQELFFRWLDVDDSGTDHSLGIDDVTISFTPVVATPGPSIINQPVPATAVVGTLATFGVDASGNPPLFYQWYKDGNPLADGGNITGATSNILTLVSVLHSNAGNYFVIITNTAGITNSTTNSLTITGFIMSRPANTNTLSGVSLSGLPITFTDSVGSVSVTPASSNTNLLPVANIAINGTGTNRTVGVLPMASSSGVVLVTLTAFDGSYSTNMSFALLVVPNTNVLFNDYFDYPDGSLDAKSAFLWRAHSGNSGETQVTNHQLAISSSLGEDVNALLTAPAVTGSGTVLYSKFTVNFSTLPSASGAYFAHLKDNTSSNFVARVWASTANTNTGGTFRLGIGNTSAAANQIAVDLNTNTTYTVVTRYDVDATTATIWLDPTNESDLSVTAGDAPAAPFAIYAYAFRQNSGEGKLLVDDLVVGTTFAAVTAPATTVAPTLQIQKYGSEVVLSWLDGAYSLQSANLVTGIYSPVITSSPYTNPISGAQQYFRLSKP